MTTGEHTNSGKPCAACGGQPCAFYVNALHREQGWTGDPAGPPRDFDRTSPYPLAGEYVLPDLPDVVGAPAHLTPGSPAWHAYWNGRRAAEVG